jgi:hypothetical protein
LPRLAWALLALPLAALPLLDCAKVQDDNGNATGGAPVSSGGSGGTIRPNTGGMPPIKVGCNGPCSDFPATPIFDTGTSDADAGPLAGDAPEGGMPCITEPTDGAMFPSNWLRPRVAFSNTNQVAKITFHSDKEDHDLVAYTKASTWAMPKDIWSLVTSHASDVGDVTVTVRIGNSQSKVKFRIAPVPAMGTMVYWSADPTQAGKDSATCAPSGTGGAAGPGKCDNDSYLEGFEVGDEMTRVVLKVSQVKQQSRDGGGNNFQNATCIGCHAGMPDSSYVVFVDSYDWRGVVAAVNNDAANNIAVGGTYPTLTPGGRQALLQPGWGPFSFADATAAPDLWTTGSRIGVASLGAPDPSKEWHGNEPDANPAPHLAWINLEAANMGSGSQSNWIYVAYDPAAGVASGNGLGILSLTGDPNGGAVFPSFSHNGTSVLYSSTHAALSGRLERNDGANMRSNKAGSTDLYTVPFNGGLGGKVAPVDGAATKDFEEYLGAYSPDDNLIAFTRVPAGERMYANPNAEIAIVPAGGGKVVTGAVNQPPACSGKKSPGVNNVWPRWSPAVQGFGGLTYYFIIFSSNRMGLTAKSTYMSSPVPIVQLYVATVTIDELQQVVIYPAIYLWNQKTDRMNLTPAWSTFTIPPIG